MLFYIIVYDIPSDKRRKKVSDLLEGYGRRVQYSVFECMLTQDKFEELKTRLRKRIKTREDNLRLYPLSSSNLARVEIWGSSPPLTQLPGSVVI
ncbi:MAG: CRISPR-associated endonuclease Cas2 [Cyanobacteriota bacterium]|nr:CRISPR-associated endonuclease Cas2 [Cyanobacteriota bacterium]